MGGRRSRREGIHVYTQTSHFILQQKLTQPCKTIILLFKSKQIQLENKKAKKSSRKILNLLYGIKHTQFYPLLIKSGI